MIKVFVLITLDKRQNYEEVRVLIAIRVRFSLLLGKNAWLASFLNFTEVSFICACRRSNECVRSVLPLFIPPSLPPFCLIS